MKSALYTFISQNNYAWFKRFALLMLSVGLLYICLGIFQYIQRYDYHTINQSLNNQSQNSVLIKYDYQIDPNNSLSIDDILRSDKFSSIQTLQSSFSQNTHWLKYQVTNNTLNHQKLVLHIDSPMLSELKLYDVSNSYQADTLFKSPDLVTVQGQVFPHHAFYLQQGETKTFILKTQTFKHSYVPLLLYSEENFLNKKQLNQVIFITFIVTVLVIVFYNLVIFNALKDKIYFIYVAYLLIALIVLSGINGFGFYIFPTQIQVWLYTYSLFFHYALASFLLLFNLYFLKYEQRKNKVYKITLYLIFFYNLIGFFSYFYQPSLQAKLFFISIPFVYLWCLLLIIPRIKSDFSWARLYYLSWLPLIAGSAIQPLVLLNILEYSLFTRHAFLFAISIEILFMACALAERMRRYEQNRIMGISYHANSLIPRKANLESTLNQLIVEKNKSAHILVIKPENIDHIVLHIDDNAKIALFKDFYKALFSHVKRVSDVVSFNSLNEKICLLENERFALIFSPKNKDSHYQSNALSNLINQLQACVFEHYKIDDFSISLSANIGVAKYPEHGNSSDALISHAQVACNNASENANRWAFYLNEQNQKNHDLIRLASDLKNALLNDELEIYHQPQVDLKTLRVCGSECLIRWHHKELGFISPITFISIAENIGLITPLTLWVVKKALNQHAQITENETFNHMVSINISGKDVESPSFFSDITEIIEHSGVAPEKIIFEITESSEIINNQHAVDVIEKLVSVGLTISIDDFGTGYSSLAYINTLPFQELKIDRQFVENVCDDIKRKIIAETSVKMAKGLGLEVVAEGVNSKLDEETLRQFGCDIGQGYYYAKPMPIEEYIDWLNNQVNAQIPESYYGEFIPAEK